LFRRYIFFIFIILNVSNVFSVDFIDIADIEATRIKRKENISKKDEKYIPNLTSYNDIPIKSFSSDWEMFYIFEKEKLLKNDIENLIDVNNDGSNLCLTIIKNDFVLICGLYVKKNGEEGSFVAKLDKNKKIVLEILEMNGKREKPIYLEDDGNRFFIVKRLYSANFLYAYYDNITVLHKEIYN